MCHEQSGRFDWLLPAGLGECRRVKEGVDAGGDRRRGLGRSPPREMLGSASYNAHVRIVSGSVVPDGDISIAC